ncbi:phage holin family protein [Paenibacillus odorifer]|uniref:phage holin family protein n=1 Tax=Paenibacillus odorifer TaxID=189426 RepID=UPI00273E971B|nr:phage holin family protein [Paenibacillus odorifer]
MVYIVTLMAIVFAVLMLGFVITSLIQGILCGAVAVYGNQLVKQAKKSGDEE